MFVGTYISAVSNAASDAALRYSKIYWDTNALAADLTERGLPNFVRSGPYAASFARSVGQCRHATCSRPRSASRSRA